MGQRSQIYVRVNKRDGGYYLAARYFQWNYGERMVSRARYTLEWLQHNYGYFNNDTYKKLIRIIDTNFDFKDVCISSDILADCDIDSLFHDDNNDGKFFLDAHIDWESKEFTYPVKFSYAFTDCCNEIIMNGDNYMQWDNGNEEPWRENEYIKKHIKYTERNIKYISKNATLMTSDDLKQFMDYKYEVIA